MDSDPLALCLACGDDKPAALVACPACAYQPVERTAQARHLVAAELAPARRRSVVDAVRAGDDPALDPEQVAVMEAALAEATPLRVGLFALGVLALPVAALVALLLVLALGLRAL